MIILMIINMIKKFISKYIFKEISPSITYFVFDFWAYPLPLQWLINFHSVWSTLTESYYISFCVSYPYWVILHFKINESYKTFDSNKSFRFCLNTLNIRSGGIPFGHPLGLGWLFQTVVCTLTVSCYISFCVSYPYYFILTFFN